jgi:hypothetical protein
VRGVRRRRVGRVRNLELGEFRSAERRARIVPAELGRTFARPARGAARVRPPSPCLVVR